MSSTTAFVAAHATSAPQRTFRIPLSTGIFDHYREVGDALWLLLFYIDKTTEERPGENGKLIGIVLGGRPVPDAEVAKAFGCAVYTIRRWRRLDWHGVIRTRRTPFGPVIEVMNSRKWRARRQEGSVEAPVLETRRGLRETHRGVRDSHGLPLGNEEGCARNAQYKEDSSRINRIQDRLQGAARAASPTAQNNRLPSRNSGPGLSVKPPARRTGERRAGANEGGPVPISEILEIIRKAKADFEAKFRR